MNDEQINISESIITTLAKNDGILRNNQLWTSIKEVQNLNGIQYEYTFRLLKELAVIRVNGSLETNQYGIPSDNRYVELTIKGFEANEAGFKNWYKVRNELEDKKNFNIRGTYFGNLVNITATIMFLIFGASQFINTFSNSKSMELLERRIDQIEEHHKQILKSNAIKEIQDSVQHALDTNQTM